MKKRIPNVTGTRSDKMLATFSIVSFGEDADDYKDYLVIKNSDDEGIVVDLDDGEAWDRTTDSMSYSDIEDFLQYETERSHHILRVIDGEGVEVIGK